MSGKVVIAGAALVAMVVFAVQGGEYTVWDYMQLDRELDAERDSIVRLQQAIDSLTARERAAREDPRTQERIAREQYGMLRPGEHLFRVVPGDTQP